MPEGHKTHHLAREHREKFAGQVLAVSSPQGRFKTGAALVDGRRLTTVEAVGKHLWYVFEGEPGEPHLVHIHLGRYGKVTEFPAGSDAAPPEPVGQVRVRMVGARAGFDLRGPTRCETVTEEERAAVEARLGPDPLRPSSPPTADRDAVWERVRTSRKAIGGLLMDQSVLAGVGNIFRAEALYELRMDPGRPGESLTKTEWDRLWRVLTRMLKTGLEYGRIITRTAKEAGKPRAELFGLDRFRIYRQPRCPACGTETMVWELAGRTMYGCGRCQGMVGS